ncbi:hypothetical protein Q3G72_025263 [Acer saccharum]|nr:hypothetical protein Q3G72_025263 [Acer saccharum]
MANCVFLENSSIVFRMKLEKMCPPGPFSISFSLPGQVDPRMFSSTYQPNGILEVIVRKRKFPYNTPEMAAGVILSFSLTCGIFWLDILCHASASLAFISLQYLQIEKKIPTLVAASLQLRDSIFTAPFSLEPLSYSVWLLIQVRI